MSEVVPIQTDDDYSLHFRLHTYNVWALRQYGHSMYVRGWAIRATVCSACLPPTHTQHTY